MLRFFRNLRFSQISNKRLAQYIGYALGEVFLVIVGILIAVNLNNVNERRKERAEINNLLRQVQSELDANIGRMDNLYLYYAQKDSVIYEFLNVVVPSQEMDDRFLGLYVSMVLNYNSAEIETDAFEALMKKAEYFPQEYTPLIQNLKALYTQSKEGVESPLNLLAESINEGIDYLGDTQSWYTDVFYRNRVPAEVKAFILSDARFINYVADYVNLSSSNLVPSTLNLKTRADCLLSPN